MGAHEKPRRDYVAECIALKDLTTAEIGDMFGRDIRGRANRLAVRMRRAGVLLASDAEWRERARSKPLYRILEESEERMKGKQYAYH